MNDEVEPLPKVTNDRGALKLERGPIKRKLTGNEALESACEAGFDQHVANKVSEGRAIVGNWSLLTEGQRREWRLIVTAAINMWLKAQE